MTEKLSETVSVKMVVNGFVHVKKGQSVLAPDGRTRMANCPGDAIFANVSIAGHTFGVSVVAMGSTGCEPGHFEGALRGMISALAEHCGVPQEAGVVVVERGVNVH